LASKNGKNKLQVKVEAILEKQRENPQYVLTNKERKILKDWNLKQLNDRKREVEQNTREVKKQNDSLKKRRKVKTTIPKSTQQTIPYVADYIEGMFEVTPNKFSKVYLIEDINYRTGKEDEQVHIFVKLGEFLNYFSDDVRFSFCIDNRSISRDEYERKVFCKMEGDSYDTHREEMNNVLRTQMIAGRNDMQIHKFITVTIDADTPIEALLRFHKLDAEIITNLRRIGANGRYLETEERLEYYHDKLRKGSEGEFHIDYDFIMKQGLSTKDYIAPSFIYFQNKYFQIEDEYYCGMFLNNLPASLQDDFLYDMCDNEFPVTTTLAIESVAQDKGLMIVKRQLTGIEMNKIDAEKKAIRAGYSPETIQHSIKDAHKQAETMYDDMMNKNQKMFFVTILFLVHGSTLEELNENCKILKSKARKYTTQLQELRFQQEEAFKVTLPFGYPPKDLSVERALTTESTAIFMPFANQELFQPTGFYYGMNPMSHNLVIVDRKKMKTPSGFILGTSGSGKSFAVKREMLNVLLRDSQANVLVIDPENEYGGFCRIMGGTVLKISSDSDCYINPMDMLEDYGLTEEDDSETTPIEIKKEKAIRKKTEYIMSIVERMISVNGSADSSTITPQQRTLIDKCVKETYKEYLEHNFDPAYMPTLLDLQNVLNSKKSESEDAEKVAEGIEYYTTGSMNVFSHHTNININNRFVVFNVRDLGEQLKQVALIIVFDFIWNRMVENKFKGIRTYCYCDEIHVMFQSYYASEQLKQLYKRGRKYGLVITGITQNCEELLASKQAKGMVGNSDFILMLNQHSEDLKKLCEMLPISETLEQFVKGADAGCGLLFAEKVVVPVVDKFPSSSYLYHMMSTAFGEGVSEEDIRREVERLQSKYHVETPLTDEEVEHLVNENHSLSA
jgi:hypothetical protein